MRFARTCKAVTPAKEREGASNDSRLNREGKAYSSAMTAIAGVSQYRELQAGDPKDPPVFNADRGSSERHVADAMTRSILGVYTIYMAVILCSAKYTINGNQP